jgi:hypothetical protein
MVHGGKMQCENKEGRRFCVFCRKCTLDSQGGH